MGVFAASAIYGYVIEAQCSSYRRRNDPHAGENNRLPERGFPGSVLEFGWDTDAAHAAQICRTHGQEWFLEGSVGLCQSTVPSAAHPDVKLEFELGRPARIIAIYRSAPQTLNENYGQIFTDLQKNYGPPQTNPAHVSSACTESFARCLENGEHPTGPIWIWANGTIELAPIWQEDHALLELRYTRSDTQTP